MVIQLCSNGAGAACAVARPVAARCTAVATAMPWGFRARAAAHVRLPGDGENGMARVMTCNRQTCVLCNDVDLCNMYMYV